MKDNIFVAMPSITLYDTKTIEDFKRSQYTETLDIRKNEKTGELYFTFYNKKENQIKIGKIENNKVPKCPLISKIVGPFDDYFYILHENHKTIGTIIATL